MNETRIKTIAGLTKTAYEEFLKVEAQKPTLNPNKVNLSNKIRSSIFKLGNKYGATYYGSFVTANNIRMRKTEDFDMYIPEKNMFKFLEAVKNEFPATTLTPNKFGMWKIRIKNKDVADIGYTEQIKRNKSGMYTITEAPLCLKSKENPMVTYQNNIKARTLKVEHLAKANSALRDTLDYKDKKHRYAKDVYDFGVINRNLIVKLFVQYKTKPTVKLNNIINKLVREVVLYSSGKQVKDAREELEKQLISTKMINFELFDSPKNKQLQSLKRKLKDPKFDITKNKQDMNYFKTKPVD